MPPAAGRGIQRAGAINAGDFIASAVTRNVGCHRWCSSPHTPRPGRRGRRDHGLLRTRNACPPSAPSPLIPSRPCVRRERGARERRPRRPLPRVDHRPDRVGRHHRPGLRRPARRDARVRARLPRRRLRRDAGAHRRPARRSLLRRGRPRRAARARRSAAATSRRAIPTTSPASTSRSSRVPDPAARRRARPLLHRGRRPPPRAVPPARRAGRARVDDVPGHDRGAAAADPRGGRGSAPAPTSSSATRPSASTPATPSGRS